MNSGPSPCRFSQTLSGTVIDKKKLVFGVFTTGYPLISLVFVSFLRFPCSSLANFVYNIRRFRRWACKFPSRPASVPSSLAPMYMSDPVAVILSSASHRSSSRFSLKQRMRSSLFRETGVICNEWACVRNYDLRCQFRTFLSHFLH